MDVGSAVSRAARMYSDQPAIEVDNVVRTHGEVNTNANRFANFLGATGHSGGVRIAMILSNRIEFPEVEFGIAKAGLVSVQINPMLSPADIHAILQDSAAEAVIFDSTLLETVDVARRDTLVRAFVAVGESELPEWASQYRQVLAEGAAQDPRVDVAGDSLCRLAYTSGTTGQPKGVSLSHRAVLAVAFNLLLEFGPGFCGHRLLHLQPLCHGTGMFVLPWFLRGGTSVVHRRFDPERVVEARKREHIDTIKLVPSMFVRMLQQGEDAIRELQGIDRIIYGASPMPVERLRQGIELLGPVFSQLYGQSESPMTITVLTKEDHTLDQGHSPHRLGSAGRPWTNVDVRVIGADGAQVQPGEPGEVIVSGPQNMVGYWNRPEETAKTLVNGWVHTRDIGTFDEQGFLYLLDRKEDMVITGGLNVYPRQVEEVLYQHGSVYEAAVIGVPDDYWGERLVAVVSTKSNVPITAADLIAFCRGRLSGYKTPKDIVFVDQIPKSPFGKISRNQVRKLVSGRGFE